MVDSIQLYAEVKSKADYREYLNYLWDYYEDDIYHEDDSPILKGRKQVQAHLKKLEMGEIEDEHYSKMACKLTYDILSLKRRLSKGIKIEDLEYFVWLLEIRVDMEHDKQESETFYNIINRHKNIKVINKEALKNEIKKALNTEDDQIYAKKVFNILSDVFHYVHQRSKDLYRKIFFEDIKRYCGTPKAVALAMYLEGFRDLIDFYNIYLPESLDNKERFLHIKTDKELKILEEDLIWTLDTNARYEHPLLIVGESGTGKQLLAGVVHTISNRRCDPFVQINCAAIPDTMLETELFGYEKGAFTGAHKKKDGLFKLARNGTIFLDEIGKMPSYLQAKLLKVIDEKEFRPLASTEVDPIKLHARCIAAAQPSDISNMITDLKYRFGYPDIIRTKNLNEKLVENGMKIIISIFKNVRLYMELDTIRIDNDCFDLLMNYKYEGNFRELENICRASIKTALRNNRNVIKRQDIVPLLQPARVQSNEPTESYDILSSEIQHIRLRDIIDYANHKRTEIVKNKIKESLEKHHNIKSTLIAEGLPKGEYQNFWKKLTRITGGNIRDLNKPAQRHP